MERAVQIFAAVNFAIIGVSHVLRPRAWVDFFAVLRGRGEAGVFAVAIPTLMFGSIIVAFHNVWSGIPLVLTLVGWAHVAKALAQFAFPSFALRKLQLPSLARPGPFVAGGVAFLLLAALLCYHLWATA
jgi:hypothetical protein